MLAPPFSRWVMLVLFGLVPISAFLYLASIATTKVQCLSCTAFLITAPTTYTTINATPEALNTTNHNLIPNPAGLTFYYNATGDVPSYHETTPNPEPITPINSTLVLLDAFYEELLGIANGSFFADNCSQCVAGAETLHRAAATQPVSTFTELLIKICNAVPTIQNKLYAKTCEAQYGSVPNASLPYSNGAAGLGAYYAQLFSKMSNATEDFSTYCHYQWSACPEPSLIGIDESQYFGPKPESAMVAPTPSGNSIDVLHLSDWHLDPRYDIGSEANCTSHLCCRPDAINKDLNTTALDPSLPASRFGSLLCDSPPDLALSAFQSMPQFFNISDLAFSIFTGDIVSHDLDDALSQSYVGYEEEITYRTFKAALGNIPLYATLGNHDSFPQGLNTQNDLASSNAFSWNYELLSSLWQNASWLNTDEASYAATHYAAYAHTHPAGLRIISINTDFWYKANIFNYWNTTNPDTSGTLKFLADELTACESRGQRAWIIGHVLSGYDGKNALPNPTALFYSIVARFSPNTIAAIFFGHTHQQQFQIFYDYLPHSTNTLDGKTYRNTTMVDYSKPLTMAFIGPSIVPLTNLNAGYTLYQVDNATFEVTGMQTYFANISNSLSWTMPVWEFEYDVRKAYSPTLSVEWPDNSPLNATFWHAVTEKMLHNTSLVKMYSLFETKSSVVTQKCDTLDCAKRKVCYIRSGNGWLGSRCPKAVSSS